MELRQIRYFVILAEELHFGNAAKRIHIAQSALSQQIKKLEDELSTLLFSRDKHSVALTDTGKVFLIESKKILEQVRQAETVASQVANGYQGKLSLGFVESALWNVMPELIRGFRNKYPKVEIVPHHMNTIEQIEALRNGHIDAGLVGTKFDLPGVNFLSIKKDKCLLAVPTWHPLAKRKKIDLRNLSNESFVAIRRESGPFYYDYFIQNCMDNGFSPDIVLTADEMQPLLAFVSSGIGIALIHESAKHIRQDLCYIPITGVSGPRYEIALAWNAYKDSIVLNHFIDEAKEILKT